MTAWRISPALGAVLLAFAGAARAGEVTITATYVNSLDRVAPSPRAGVITRHELTVILSGGKQVMENWNSQSGNIVRRNSSIRVLGADAERGGAWRVISGNRLQRSIDYRQNVTLLTITVDGQSCQLDADYRLKPGFSDYTFRRARSREWAYYGKPRVVSTECTIR